MPVWLDRGMGMPGDMYSPEDEKNTQNSLTPAAELIAPRDSLVEEFPGYAKGINAARAQGIEDGDIYGALRMSYLHDSATMAKDDLFVKYGQTPENQAQAARGWREGRLEELSAMLGMDKERVAWGLTEAETFGLPAQWYLDANVRKTLPKEYRLEKVDSVAEALGARHEAQNLMGDLADLRWRALFPSSGNELTPDEANAMFAPGEGTPDMSPAAPLTRETAPELFAEIDEKAKRLAEVSNLRPAGVASKTAASTLDLFEQAFTQGIRQNPKLFFGTLTGGAALGALIGGLPGAVAGVAKAYPLAQRLATGMYFVKMSVTDMYESLISLEKDGKPALTPKQARDGALLFGSLIAAIEDVSLGRMAGAMVPQAARSLAPVSKVLSIPENMKTVLHKALSGDRGRLLMNTPSFKKTLLETLGNYAANVGAESVEEGEQKFVEVVGGAITTWLAGNPVYTVSEAVEKAVKEGARETLASAETFAYGMAIPNIIGLGTRSLAARSYNRSAEGQRHEAARKLVDAKMEAPGEAPLPGKAPENLTDLDFVSLPQSALETLYQSSPEAKKAAEELGLTGREAVEGTGEIVMTSDEFERLKKAAPEVENAAGEHIRHGLFGRTTAEVHRAVVRQDRANDPFENDEDPDAKAARGLRFSFTKELRGAGQNADLAAMNADLWSRYVYNRTRQAKARGKETSVDAMAERLKVRHREEASARGDEGTYDQLLGPRGAGVLDNYEESTARLDALDSARRMEKRGKDTLAIRLATGWERGADGKWRYEIPDGDLKLDLLDKPGKTTLDEVFDAPELYRGYPELADIVVEVKFLPTGRFGSYNPQSRTMELNQDEIKKDPAEARRTVVHEIQHAVQDIEGFASGGNQSGIVEVAQKQRRAAGEKYDKVVKKLKRRGVDAQEYEAAIRDEESAAGLRREDEEQKNDSSYTPEQRARVADVIAYKEQKIRQIEEKISPALCKEFRNAYAEKRRAESDWERTVRDGFQTYRALGGEVESRNVERRMDMSAEERLKTLLTDTEDVAREDQIFITAGIGEGARIHAAREEVKRQGRLKQDRVAWSRAVDKFVAGGMSELETSRVMDMPLALQLSGAPANEIVAGYRFFSHTLRGKHSAQITPALMKKLVTSLADPIMVFDSDSHPGTSLVAMLELQDNQGATVVVPVRLQMDPTDPKSPAILTSFYGKGDSKTGIPGNRWFVNQIKKGNLRYINTKKSTRWSSVSGLQLPKALAPTGSFKDSIKTEADLVKLRKENGNKFYQEQDAIRRGQIQFGPGGTSLVTLFKDADASTFVHEMGHLMLRDLLADALEEDAGERERADLAVVKEYLGLSDEDAAALAKGSADDRLRQKHERFARAFEAYLLTGQAPNKGLKHVFAWFRRELLRIYADVRALDVELSPEIAALFDRLLSVETAEDETLNITVNDLALEENLLKQRLEELEGMEDLLPDPGDKYDEGYERGVKAGRKQGVKEGREKLRAQLKAARQKRDEIRKLVKSIKTMAKSRSVIWDKRQELLKLLEGYTLRRPTDAALQRGADVRAYLDTHPEADEADLSRRDRELLHTFESTTLRTLTVGDLRELAAKVTDIYTQGHEEYARWKEARRQRRLGELGDLLEAVESRASVGEKEGTVASSRDLDRPYEGAAGKARKAKDALFAWGLGAQRLTDWIGNGKGKFKSAVTRFFVDKVNVARDGMLRQTTRRQEYLEQVMKDTGLSYLDLGRKRAVMQDHLKDGRVVAEKLSLDALLAIYALMKNKKGRAAVLFGNMAQWADPEGHAQKCLSLLSEKEKLLADAVIGEYAANFDRLNDVFIRVYNQGMTPEKNYVPMSRLEYTSSLGWADDKEAVQELAFATAQAGARASLEKGFLIDRMEISEENQKPVELGLVSTWLTHMKAQEHTAAYAELAGDLSSVMGGVRRESDGLTFKKAVSARLGKGAFKALNGYVNIVLQDEFRIANNMIDKCFAYFAGNMAATYLAGSVSVLLKQLTSIPRFVAYADCSELLRAFADFASKDIRKEVYDLDPQMRERLPSATMTLFSGIDETKLSRVQWQYKHALDAMMKPIMAFDRSVALIGWLAAYRTQIKRGASQEAAVREAQRAVALTQQVPHIKDMPMAWQTNKFVRYLMMFTTDAAPQFGMSAYDFFQGLRDGGDKGTSARTLLALTMTAILMKSLTDGGPDDPDDPDQWFKWIMSALSEQTLENVPLFGKELASAVDQSRGGYGGQGVYMPWLFKIIHGFSQMHGERADKVGPDGLTGFARGMLNAVEGFSLVAVPMPVTAAKRFYRMAKADDAAETLKILIGQRRRQKKKERRWL